MGLAMISAKKNSFCCHNLPPFGGLTPGEVMCHPKGTFDHEGLLGQGFHFHDGRMPMLNTDPDVIANARFQDLRAIVVFGCIEAVLTYGGR
jgi:hypothetical protein